MFSKLLVKYFDLPIIIPDIRFSWAGGFPLRKFFQPDAIQLMSEFISITTIILEMLFYV
jgi:hypothetical protein